MSATDLRHAADQLGLSGNAMAAALGISRRTWRRWLAGQDVPHWVPAMIATLASTSHGKGATNDNA